MRFFSFICLLSFILLQTGCTVYRSPQRKDFESDADSFHVQNLKISSCSGTSIKTKASASKLVTVIEDKAHNESQFLWEYIVADQSYFESDNLQGEYCAFEKN